MRENVIMGKKKKNKNNIILDGKIGKDLPFASREAYNLLRTNLTFSLTDVEGCKVVGVTSAVPAEGKSYTSLNLAYVLASDSKKVLFIDGDFRKSNVAKTLKIKTKPGLIDWFADKTLDIFNKGVLSENLTVVVAGTCPANPSEIMGSTSMKDFINEAKKDYDYIIIDFPPICVVTDALVLSKELDGIVLVVKHGFSRLKYIKKAANLLKFSEIKILGLVYNAFYQGTSNRYYKSKNYYSSYSYRKDGKNDK